MPRRIDNWESFYEANIRNNSALDRDYIENIKRTEEREARRKIQSGEVMDPRRIMGHVEQIMRLQGGRLEMTQFGPIPIWEDRNRKEQVEQLARDIIDEQYGRLINALNIEMDIKLVDPQEMQDMKMGNEMADEEEETDPEPEWEETDDASLKDDVDKRKIANIITQGSAKNTHRLIHLFRDKIEEFNPRLFQLMDELIKAQEVMEWTLPENDNNGIMIRQMMNGFSKTEFDNKEDEEEVEDRAEDIDLDALLNGDEDEMDKAEEAFEDFDGRIKVTARAIDLIVLLHEAVKGIYEVLSSPSLPQYNATRAEDIMKNTDTLQDEFEDLRYGPSIRRDLLDWVNSNDKVTQIEDGFEYVWGEMISIESERFLQLFYDAIIGKTGDADRWLDQFLDTLIQEEEELRRAQYEWDEMNNPSEEAWKKGTKYKEEEEDIEEEEPAPDFSDLEDDEEEDYSKLSKRDLEQIMNKALDEGDYETVAKIQQYL